MSEIEITTKNQFEIVDITAEVQKQLNSSKVKSGAVVVFAPHTTAAVRMNHNEPLLKQDIMKMLYRIAPVDVNYSHDFFEIRENLEPDERSNGHAHVKSFLLGASETIPVEDGKLVLGGKQSIFLVELDGGRRRRVVINVIGS